MTWRLNHPNSIIKLNTIIQYFCHRKLNKPLILIHYLIAHMRMYCRLLTHIYYYKFNPKWTNIYIWILQNLKYTDICKTKRPWKFKINLSLNSWTETEIYIIYMINISKYIMCCLKSQTFPSKCLQVFFFCLTER